MNMLYFWIWIALTCITVYFNQKANGDAGKLAKDIKQQEPSFFQQNIPLIDLVNLSSSSFIFMLYNNSYKKIQNPELLKRCKAVKMMSVKSMLAGFILLTIALCYVIYHSS